MPCHIYICMHVARIQITVSVIMHGELGALHERAPVKKRLAGRTVTTTVSGPRSYYDDSDEGVDLT